MPEGTKIFTTIVFIFYIIIFSIGLVNVVAPRWYWEKFESWKATKEPSRTYFLVKRMTGVVVMIIIATIALVPALIYYFTK